MTTQVPLFRSFFLFFAPSLKVQPILKQTSSDKSIVHKIMTWRTNLVYLLSNCTSSYWYDMVFTLQEMASSSVAVYYMSLFYYINCYINKVEFEF